MTSAVPIGEPVRARRLARSMPLRAEGGLVPLFLVHADDGDLDYAHALAPWIDPDLPLFGLATADTEDAAEDATDGAQATSVEQMAAAYVTAMRSVQPEGPYRLAGRGGGGMLAYEMVNQLIGADQAVAFLGLIDTPLAQPWPAGARAAPPALFDDWLAALSWVPAGLAGAPRAELAALATEGASDALLLCARSAGLFDQDMAPQSILKRLTARHALALALSHYARPPISVPVHLFCAADGADPTLGWQAALGRRLRTTMLPAPQALSEAPEAKALGAALSAALRDTASAAAPEESFYAARLAIQSGSAWARALFCVPGAGASVTALAALAGELDPSIPVHGLQPRGLCGVLAPHIDVPSAARAYLNAVRLVQPRGPYRLLGHSFGGWVAYEMARQLNAAGESVACLIVLDTEAPGAGAPHSSRVATLTKLVEIFQLGAQAPIGLGAADFAALDHDAQLALLLQRLIAVRLLPPRTGIEFLRGIVRVFGTNLNTDYRPAGLYQGVLHLVAVPDPAQAFDPTELVALWRLHAPQTRFWPGPGNHMTLLSPPYVGRLAAYLNPLLKEST